MEEEIERLENKIARLEDEITRLIKENKELTRHYNNAWNLYLCKGRQNKTLNEQNHVLYRHIKLSPDGFCNDEYIEAKKHFETLVEYLNNL